MNLTFTKKHIHKVIQNSKTSCEYLPIDREVAAKNKKLALSDWFFRIYTFQWLKIDIPLWAIANYFKLQVIRDVIKQKIIKQES